MAQAQGIHALLCREDEGWIGLDADHTLDAERLHPERERVAVPAGDVEHHVAGTEPGRLTGAACELGRGLLIRARLAPEAEVGPLGPTARGVQQRGIDHGARCTGGHHLPDVTTQLMVTV